MQSHDPAGDPRPIGVFDSGVGGLTVLSEIRRRLPVEATVYLGDNARTPYGPRPASEVRQYTLECAHWLLRQDRAFGPIYLRSPAAAAVPAGEIGGEIGG